MPDRQPARTRDSRSRCARTLRDFAAAGIVLALAAAPGLAQEPPDDLAVLEGVVLVEGTSRPLPTALVALLGQDRRAFADSAGRFRLTGVAPGEDTLQVSLLEFRSERIPVTIAPGGRHSLELVVAYPSATLEELVVNIAGARSERMRGFERRRRRGIGSFITAAEIRRRNPIELSWMFWGLRRVRMHGERVMLDTRGVALSLTRGRALSGQSTTVLRDTGECAPAIFVDGAKRGPATRVNDFDPDEIEGIEVYASPFIPARFADAFNRCGSIVIWRRIGRGPG